MSKQPLTYRINFEKQTVYIGEDDMPAIFSPDYWYTWRSDVFLSPKYWRITAEEVDVLRVVRDELIDRGLIPDE